MDPSNWTVGIITAPRKQPTLQRTVESLAAAGFNPPTIFAEPGSPVDGLANVVHRPAKLGPWRNWLQSLRDLIAMNPHAEAVLLCEDDVVFTAGAQTFLQSQPWPSDRVGALTLYTSARHELHGKQGPHWITGSLIGACALAFPMAAAKRLAFHHLARVWPGAIRQTVPDELKACQDTFVSRLCRELRLQVWAFSPSLAQHIGETSTIGSRASPAIRRSNTFPGEAAAPRERAKIHGKPRVAFFVPSLGMGGAERWQATLAEHCTDIEFTGTAVSGGDAIWGPFCRTVAARMPVYVGNSRTVATGGDCPFTRTAALTEAFRRAADGANVVLSWGLSILPGLCREIGFNGRVVMVAHGGCQWTRKLVEQAMPVATDLAAVSEFAARTFPADSSPVVLHNGADERRLVPSETREQTRTAWGCRPEQILVGYVGRLSPEKNVPAVAHAVSRLDSRHVAVIVGDGWKRDLVRSQVAAILPPERVRWIDPPANIGNAFQALDCVVLASPSEGFSLVTIEAWLAGIPLVGTPVGATPEIEREFGPVCVSVPVDPLPSELADAVRRAVSPENRVIVERARAIASQYFTAKAMAARWETYLKGL